MNQPKGRLFVISAPTGGGKTTITQTVIKNLIDTVPISKVVTYTTRSPRPNENDGIDYHFVPESEFADKQLQGDFLETTMYDGHWYGSPKAILTQIAQGKSFILVTDRAGVKAIKALVPDAVFVWITVPSIEILANRLRHRKTQDSAEPEQRLAIAAQEMDQEDKEPLCNHHIMNNNLQDAVDALERLIIQEIGRNPETSPG